MGKTTEDFKTRHAKDAKLKIEGEKKIKHRRIKNDTNYISSTHSYVSQALRVRMRTKPSKLIVPTPPKQPTHSTSELAPPLTPPQTIPVIAKPPRRPKRKDGARLTPIMKLSQK